MAYAAPPFAVRADDPPYWNPDWKLGDMLHRLAQLSPDDMKGIELIAMDCLRRRLREQHIAMLAEWNGR